MLVLRLRTILMTCVLFRAMGGELFDRVVKHDGLSEDIAKLYFFQMLLAIEVSLTPVERQKNKMCQLRDWKRHYNVVVFVSVLTQAKYNPP